MNVICAFSSDSRELYKADIYRVFSLPEGHIVQFRYKKKYVDDNLLNKENDLINNKVAIFFTHGNKLGDDNNKLDHISVRWATISKVEISKETGVFHAYLKLDKFCNVTVDSKNSAEKKPPSKYFSSLECTEASQEISWQDRVIRIKDNFNKMTFFYLKGIYKKDKKQDLTYDESGKSCFYELCHGDRYSVKLSVGNPDSTDTKILILGSNDDVTINCINPIETSVQFDDYDIPISVKTLQTMNQYSLLTFKPTEVGNSRIGEYETNIELNLKISWRKPILFGFFSSIAVGAVLLATPSLPGSVSPSVGELILAAFLFWLSTGLLFLWFNKK